MQPFHDFIYAWVSSEVGKDRYRKYLVTLKANVTTADGNHDDECRSSINLTSLLLDMPDFIDPRCTGFFTYLLESCGQVYYVCLTATYDPRYDAVEVWELDLEKKKWVEVNSLIVHFSWGMIVVRGVWQVLKLKATVCLILNHDDGADNALYQFRLKRL